MNAVIVPTILLNLSFLEGEQHSDLFIYTEEFNALPNVFISEHLSLAASCFPNG